MTDRELFHQLAIAALTGLAGTRTGYPENIAKEVVKLATVTLAEIKKQEAIAGESSQ